MSDTVYQNPQAEMYPELSPARYVLTDKALGCLKGTASWVVFLGILMFIACGFSVLLGISSLIMGIGGPMLNGFDFGFDDEVPELFIGLVYIVTAGFIFIPARFLYGFGKGLRNFFISRAGEDLEKAFKNNKSFWKFNGVLAIISLALFPVALITFFITLLLSVLQGL